MADKVKYIYGEQFAQKLPGSNQNFYFRTVTSYEVDGNGKPIEGSAQTNLYYAPKPAARTSDGKTWTPGTADSADNFDQGGWVTAGKTLDNGKSYAFLFYTQRDADLGRIPPGKNVGDEILGATTQLSLTTSGGRFYEAVQNNLINLAANTQPGLAKVVSAKQTNASQLQPPPPPPGPDPLTPRLNPDPNFNISTIQTGGVVGSSKPNEEFKKILKYPLNESRGYDYLKINILEYVSSGIPQLSTGNLNTIDVEERFRETSILGTIFLPMQPGISDSASSSWNEDNLNPVQAAIGGLAGNLINAGGAIDYQRILSELQNAAGGAKSIIQNNAILGQFIDNYFAQQIVGSNLFARNTGAVINPNLELLFNGPKMRTFNYNYRFTPRDDKEAKEVRSIIKVLKKNSLPKKDPTGLFLKTPNVFKLKYVFSKNGKEEEHPYLNKIKVCALTDMNVNYTPDGSYSTYTDGSMTSYTVSLSFSELNPIYYDDFDDNSIDTPTMGY